MYETETLFGLTGNLFLNHEHAQPVKARGDTGVSSPLVPFGGFEYVFLHAVALFVDEAEGEEAGRLVVAGTHLIPFDGLFHVAMAAEGAVVIVFAHVFLGLGVAVFGGEFHVSDDLGIVLLDKEPLHVHESEGVLGVGVVALGGIGEPVVGLFVVDLDPGAVEVDVAQAVGRLGFTHLSRLQQRGDGLGVPFDVAQVDATLQKLVAEALGHACLSAGLLELQGLLVQLAGLGVGIVLGCHLLDGNAHESLVGNVGSDVPKSVYQGLYRPQLHAVGTGQHVLARSGGQVGRHEAHSRTCGLDVYRWGHVAQCIEYHFGVVAVRQVVGRHSSSGQRIDYQCPVADAFRCGQVYRGVDSFRCSEYVFHNLINSSGMISCKDSEKYREYKRYCNVNP